MGGHAAVGAVAAVGGVAHFTCNFSIWVGHAAGGSCCAFLGGGTCCAPSTAVCKRYYPCDTVIFHDFEILLSFLCLFTWRRCSFKQSGVQHSYAVAAVSRRNLANRSRNIL